MKKSKNGSRQPAKNRQQSHLPSILFGLVALILMAALLFAACKKHQQDTPPTASALKIPQSPPEDLTVKYSLEDMKGIWEQNFQSVPIEELWQRKYPLTKIRERFDEQSVIIGNRFKSPIININLSPTYMPESRNIAAGCSVEHGIPTIAIIVPKILDIAFELRARGDKEWLQKAQNELAINVMHERDHLTVSTLYDSQPKSTLDQLAEDETRVWALTCEHTLRPMVEAKVPLTNSSYTYYRMWVQCGRNEKSPEWRHLIKNNYSETRK